MSNNKMLIDAAHPEETRVAMVRGNRVDEFDFESEHKTQLRGNIYLAKVTRVEPSLQAAFVDYGGNRHGFLAFSEIHPDYYQIPIADRQALLEAEAEDARHAAAQEAAEDDSDSSDSDDSDDDNDANTKAEAKPTRKRRSRKRGGKKADASGQDSDEENSGAKVSDSPDSTADNSNTGEANDSDEESDSDDTTMSADNENDDVVSEPASQPEEVKKPRRRTSRKKKELAAEEGAEATAEDKPEEPKAAAEEKKPARRRTSRKKSEPALEAADEATAEQEEKPKPARRRTSRKKVAEAEVASDDAAEDSGAASDAGAAQSEDKSDETEKPKKTRKRSSRAKKAEPDEETSEDTDAATGDAGSDIETPSADDASEEQRKPRGRKRSRRRKKSDEPLSGDVEIAADGAPVVEELGSDDALEEVPVRRAPRRHYKIQEVIKRRQILLVQVVKEERGNKGAALTTYLSLAGRYSVLMPNTARGGGISRKITNSSDRKRLKSIATSLDVPKGMGVILRTAGASRDNQDIQRDFEYLMRLWENVRTLTLESTAPCLVYEEGSLIKRSIRDLYDTDTGEILVAGEAGYREAKDFMAMLMPNHAKNVKLYNDRIPLFARMGVEAQLDAMLQPQVTLKSGGYLIINQTEALVAVDVNSGRSTRQHSIEDTAFQTNLEAADEVARQLRLRDLAGLIVIDFIDMEDKRNIRNVEKRLKDALKNDRARIQVGRISHFGLLEMSRQRIRASVLESTTQVCPTCEGLGHVRAASSVVLAVLRAIEEQLNRSSKHDLVVKVSTPTAMYLLNNKRDNLGDLEQRFGVSIMIETDDAMGGLPCTIDRGELASKQADNGNSVQPDSIDPAEDQDADVEASTVADAAKTAPAPETQASPSQAAGSDEEEGQGKKRRRRRRKRKGPSSDDDTQNTESGVAAGADDKEVAKGETKTAEAESESRTDDRSGESKQDAAEPEGSLKPEAKTNTNSSEDQADPVAVETAYGEASNGNGRPPRRNTKRRKDGPGSAPVEAVVAALAINGGQSETVDTTDAEPKSDETKEAEEKSPKKGGWWQRKFF